MKRLRRLLWRLTGRCRDCGGRHVYPSWREYADLDSDDGVQPPDPRPVQTLGELLRRTR